MAAVPRRDTPKPLDAHLVPLERALRARADALDARAQVQRIDELPWGQVAAEFRALADELHHW